MIPLNAKQNIKQERNMNELTGMAEKVLRYKFNMSYAYSFFLFASLFIGGFLIMVSMDIVDHVAIVITASIVIFIVGIVIMYFTFFNTLRRLYSRKMEGVFWAISFIIPPSIIIPGILFSGLPEFWVTSGFPWFISLSLSFLIVALLVERYYVNKGKLSSRPFLISGSLMLIGSPALLFVSYHVGEYSGNYLGMGLFLISAILSGTITLIRSERAFID